MAGILWHRKTTLSQQSQILSGMRIQSSVYGMPIPIVYGQARIPGNLIWYGDFKSHIVKAQGGKGGLFGAGTKGQLPNDYTAALALGLCEGPIVGIGQIWDTQGNLPTNIAQESYTIPGGGGTYQVAHYQNFYYDQGVSRQDAYSVAANDYGNPSGSITLGGVQLTPMVPGAVVLGGYTVNTGTGQYTFSAADGGKTVLINYVYSTPNTDNSGQPVQMLALTTFIGSRPQSPWGYLVTNHAAQADAYSGLAYVAAALADLGSSGALPNLTFEVSGFNQFGSGIVDAEPSAIITDLLTSDLYGVGLEAGDIADLSNYKAYCVANGLFLSPVIDSQRAAADWIKDILTATNSEAIWSSGQLKIVTYGDTTAVGNGVTFTPNTQPIYDLNDDDFMVGVGEDPVTVERPTIQDAYNSIQVEFENRGNSYNSELVEARDQNAVELYGLRPKGPQPLHLIKSRTVAALAAQTILSRSVYVRNIYKFKTTMRYVLLDPMDMVTLTDAGLGLNKKAVRIKQIEEQADGTLAFTAEEFPWGTSAPTLYPKQVPISGGPNANATPGSVNPPIMFEALSRLNDQIGHSIWFGLSGSDPNWGGCNVWISADNVTYELVETVFSKSRMGVLTASLASHADPDTTDTLSVDLTQSAGQLLSGTAGDANNFRTLCYVGGELVSYQSSALTSAYHYDLGTILRRGVAGSPISLHAIGSPFLRLDENVFTYDYDATQIGTTVYFKFTSFNIRGNNEQGLAGVTAYPFAITGASLGLLTPAHASYRPTSNALTAVDSGSFPTINVASFVIRIPGIPDITVASGSVALTSADYLKTFYVYYDDPGFMGGSVTFLATTVREDALNAAGRFFIGSINTPGAGGAPTIGNNDGGTGAQYSKIVDVFCQYQASAGGWVNPNFAVDTDGNTYSEVTYTGAGEAGMTLSGFALLTNWFNSLTLFVKSYFTALPAGGVGYIDYSLDGGFTWTNLRTISAVDSLPVDASIPIGLNVPTSSVQARIRVPGATGSGGGGGGMTAGTIANDATIAGTAWTLGSPNNVNFASFSAAVSQYLKFTNFGFAIPGGATIIGLVATVTKRGGRKSDAYGLENYITDNSAKFVKGGTFTGADLGDASNPWPTALTAFSYGSPSSLPAGLALTPADVNAATFGFGISASPNQSIAGTLSVSVSNTCTMTVYYSLGSGTGAARIYAARLEATL